MKRILILAAVALAGCNRNPSVEIVGSYFPGWMICLTLGIALTAITHALLPSPIQHRIGHPAVVYPAMVTLFTCTLWLLLFA
jgi:hypothetical protein